MPKTEKSLDNISLPLGIGAIKNQGLEAHDDVKELIKLWLKIYDIMSIEKQTRAESSLLRLATSAKFSFEDGHILFNAGLSGNPDHFNLGRGAMWLGAKIAHDSIKTDAERDVSKEKLLIHMVDSLFGDYQRRYYLPSERDRRYINTIFGKDFRDCDPGILRSWILEIY